MRQYYIWMRLGKHLQRINGTPVEVKEYPQFHFFRHRTPAGGGAPLCNRGGNWTLSEAASGLAMVHADRWHELAPLVVEKLQSEDLAMGGAPGSAALDKIKNWFIDNSPVWENLTEDDYEQYAKAGLQIPREET